MPGVLTFGSPLAAPPDRTRFRAPIESARLSITRIQVGEPEHPLIWIPRVLDIPLWTLQWSVLEEYATHKWDGTKDPLALMLTLLYEGWRLEEPIKNIGVEAATGTNKTFTAAAATLWFLGNYRNAQVRTLAPKAEQLALNLWKEIGRLWPKFKREFPTAYLSRDLTIYMKRGPGEEAWSAIGTGAAVRSGEQSNTRSQGGHAEHLLHIVEEMPGVDRSIITAIDNTSTGGHNLVLGLGNPDFTGDPLHTFATSSGAVLIRISSYDHPNVVTGKELIPGAATRAHNKKRLDDYGEEAPFYLSRVRGVCPTEASDSLIRASWIDAACDRADEMLVDYRAKRAPINGALGVDVANETAGDAAAISKWLNDVCFEVNAYRVGEGQTMRDARELGEKVMIEARAMGMANGRAIGVDPVGVGAATVSEIRRQGWECTQLGGADAVWPVAKEVEEYLNLRCQMWWRLRLDLQQGLIALPKRCKKANDPLREDLLAQRWRVQSNKIVVLPKAEVMVFLGRSPDEGDALVYGNWVRRYRRPEAGALMITH